MRKIQIARIVLWSIGALLMLDGVACAILEGAGIGVYVAVALGLLMILYGCFLPRLKGARKMHIAALCLCLMLLIPAVSLAAYGHRDTADYDEQVLIVLGAGLHDNAPSSTLAERLEQACIYYQKNPDVIIIVSGGLGSDTQMSEAAAMTAYLTARGVPASSILQEDRSTDTIENFRYSAELMRQQGLNGDSVVFITSGFHVFRAELCARQAGLNPSHIGAPVKLHTIPTNYLREVLALVKYWVLES
ncbi:MAG: YdcF family protein [Clostridia bacterium]|nr:YdcF family protein [Clostridia bacterium]